MPDEPDPERNASRRTLAIAFAFIVLVFHLVGSAAVGFAAYTEYGKPHGPAWNVAAKVLLSPMIWAPTEFLDAVDNQFFLLAINSLIWAFTTFVVINWSPMKGGGKTGFDVIEVKNT